MLILSTRLKILQDIRRKKNWKQIKIFNEISMGLETVKKELWAVDELVGGVKLWNEILQEPACKS